MQIPLSGSSEEYVLVDDEDYPLLSRYTWHKNTDEKNHTYYAHTQINIGGKRIWIYMHRLIMGYPSLRIDHRNGNGWDNQKGNLRISTAKENSRNQRLQSGTSSVYKGVHLDKRSGKWAVKVKLGKHKTVHLGYYEDETHAGHVYDFYAIKYFGTFALLNFPEYTQEYLDNPEAYLYHPVAHRVTRAERICKSCDVHFVPNSNAQKYCGNCR